MDEQQNKREHNKPSKNSQSTIDQAFGLGQTAGGSEGRRRSSRQRTLNNESGPAKKQDSGIDTSQAQPQDQDRKSRARKPPLAGGAPPRIGSQARKSGSRSRVKQKDSERKKRRDSSQGRNGGEGGSRERSRREGDANDCSLGMMQIVQQLQDEEKGKEALGQADDVNEREQNEDLKSKTKHKKKRSAVIFEDIKKNEQEIEQMKEEKNGSQFQYQAYVRQTWDISRFIHATACDAPSQQTQNDSQLNNTNPGSHKAATQAFKTPTIQKSWEQFNEFYISFIQDIDHFYKNQDLMNQSRMSKKSPIKKETDGAKKKEEESVQSGVTADGNYEDEEEELTAEIKYLREQLRKYKYQFTNIPEISHNILSIIRTLKEEDKQEMLRVREQQKQGNYFQSHQSGAMGENLEYFLENRVIETLSAYAMTDQPQGFFKFLLGVMKDLISSVSQQNNILSHISVNQSIRQILRIIYEKLLEIPFTDKNESGLRRPDDEFVLKQRPRVVFYTIDILQFIYTLSFKVQNEPHIIRLLFCKKDGLLNKYGHGDDSFQELSTHEQRLLELRQIQQQTAASDPALATGVLFGASGSSPVRNQNFMDDIVSYDICLPFHILVYYIRNAKWLLSECEKNFLDDVIVMSFNSLCIDAKFVCYLINESDFIEIIMSEIATNISVLPQILQPLNEMGHYSTFKQLAAVNPRLISEQMQDLVSNCKLLHYIFEKLNLQAKSIFDQRVKKEDGQNKLQCIAEIQKAFLREFIQIVLINTLQEKMLVGSPLASGLEETVNFSEMNDVANIAQQDSEQIRTAIQYLIEVLDSLQAKPFSMVTFAFLNGSLNSQLDRYLGDILQESVRATTASKPSQSIGAVEKYDYQKRIQGNAQLLGELTKNIQRGDSISLPQEASHGMHPLLDASPIPLLGQINNDHGQDVRKMVEKMYPERQTVSRFSLKNPNARFTQTHDMLRQTIRGFREIGKLPTIVAQLDEGVDDLADGSLAIQDVNQILAGGGINCVANLASQRILNNAILFQKQGVNTGIGAPSSNLFACESLVNQTLQEQIFTQNNIDQLFTQAQNLEAQAKYEDEYMDQLQLQQFKNYTYHGLMHQEVRFQVQHLVFRAQSDVSMITLKLLSVLIKSGGVSQFIKENFKIDQTIYRTTDDISHINDKYRLMLPISSQPRQMCLADYPELVFKSIDYNVPTPLDTNTKMSILDHCMTLLGHQLIHRQLIQLYFSDEYAIHFRLKTQPGLPKKKSGKPVNLDSEEKTANRSRLLAAAGIGGTESSGIEKRFKDIVGQISTPTTLTGASSKLRGGTGGSTGDTGGYSDFDTGLRSNSPLRGKRSVANITESFEDSHVTSKNRQASGARPESSYGQDAQTNVIQPRDSSKQNCVGSQDNGFTHLFELLLHKLLQFMDNTPNENAILCNCLLQLFEIPGQEKLLIKPKVSRLSRKKQAEMKPPFELIPLELLQWWLYSIEFVEKAPQKLSKRQQKQINDFKQNIDALRKKFGHTGKAKGQKKSKKSKPLSTNHSSQKKGAANFDDVDHQRDPKLNILAIVSQVKAHLQLFEQDQKVVLFKQLLVEDLTTRSTKKKGRVSSKKEASSAQSDASRPSTTSSVSGSSIIPRDSSGKLSGRGTEGQEKQLKGASKQEMLKAAQQAKFEEMKEAYRKKMVSELNQPYLFRDRNLIAAENCLIFNEFYERLWEQLSIIAIAIYQIRSCGPSQQESLYEKEFCQEGQIICHSEEQRETLVCRKEARLDIWNGKIDNINESLDNRERESSDGSFYQSFISQTK